MSMTTDEQFELIGLIGELSFSIPDHPHLVDLLNDPQSQPDKLDTIFDELRQKLDKVDTYFEMFEFLVKKYYQEDPAALKSIFSPFLLAQPKNSAE